MTGKYFMKFVRAIIAFISIWVIFLGYVQFHTKSPSAYILLIIGGLMLAFVYEAFRKPYFFVVPICAIFSVFALEPDCKGIIPLITLFFGIVISDMFVRYYYKKKSPSENEEK
jgi:hypothetical protein